MSYASTVLADGASNHWPLNEPSGTTAVDVIGGKNGAISGGVTLNQAGIAGGKAMTFNGTTGKIATSSLTVSNPSTVEVWVKTSAPGFYQPFFSTRTTGATGQVVFMGINPSGQVFINTATGALGLAVITDGAWHHVVVVITGVGDLTLYVNGVLDPSGEVAGAPTSTGVVSIGWDQQDGLFWTGLIDEVAIYPLALTPAQILAHYQLGAGGGGGGLLLGVG